MASTKKEFKFEVIEFLGNIKGAEDNWGITVTKMKWDDEPPKVNIRNTNLIKGVVGKGVAITDEETDVLTDILLNHDYGSVEAIEKALDRRRDRFAYSELIPEEPKFIN